MQTLGLLRSPPHSAGTRQAEDLESVGTKDALSYTGRSYTLASNEGGLMMIAFLVPQHGSCMSNDVLSISGCDVAG